MQGYDPTFQLISVNPEVQGQEKAKNIAAATLGEGGQAI